MIENMILGRIYKISSPSSAFAYYGSTTKALNQRLQQHKNNLKSYENGKYNYVTSFEIVKFNDCEIELDSECFYENKKIELRVS